MKIHKYKTIKHNSTKLRLDWSYRKLQEAPGLLPLLLGLVSSGLEDDEVDLVAVLADQLQLDLLDVLDVLGLVTHGVVLLLGHLGLELLGLVQKGRQQR